MGKANEDLIRVEPETQGWKAPFGGFKLSKRVTSKEPLLAAQVAARKLHEWAAAANDAGDIMPIQGTCLGHQLLQILATGANFKDLLVPTDAVVRCLNLLRIL